MRLMRGIGIPNVFLRNGFELKGAGDEESISYLDLDGLYLAIGLAVARTAGEVTGSEFRFLRKQLGLSQSDMARRFEKEGQTVAKWEKGSLPVPVSEGGLLKLFFLATFDRSKVAQTLKLWAAGHQGGRANERRYVAEHNGRIWSASCDEGLPTTRDTLSSMSDRGDEYVAVTSSATRGFHSAWSTMALDPILQVTRAPNVVGPTLLIPRLHRQTPPPDVRSWQIQPSTEAS